MIGSLSLDQLHVLVTIADTGGFSAAGRWLGRAVGDQPGGGDFGDRPGRGVVRPERPSPAADRGGARTGRPARLVLASAARFEAVAAGTRAGLEPELALAIDPLAPTGPLIESLRALSETYPDLPVRCRMPEHLVAAPILESKLVPLWIEDDPTPAGGLVIYAAHRRDHGLGPAGRWLLERLRQRLGFEGVAGRLTRLGGRSRSAQFKGLLQQGSRQPARRCPKILPQPGLHLSGCLYKYRQWAM